MARAEPWRVTAGIDHAAGMKELQRFTMARVGLARAGNALSTRELLDFQLAHARARDAVHYPLNSVALMSELEAGGLNSVVVKTMAKDRIEFLRRPDLGRRLHPDSAKRLAEIRGPFDAALIIADGLSAQADRLPRPTSASPHVAALRGEASPPGTASDVQA